jgi:hypothetical protein
LALNLVEEGGMRSTSCNAKSAYLFPDALLHSPYRYCAVKAGRSKVSASWRPTAASDRFGVGVLKQHRATPAFAWDRALLPYTNDFVAAAAGKSGSYEKNRLAVVIDQK